MTRQLWKSHRVLGYEVARTTADNGTEYVVLQTAPYAEAVSPAHMLRPFTADEVAFDVTADLIGVVHQAAFLGMDEAAIRAAMEAVLELLRNTES